MSINRKLFFANLIFYLFVFMQSFVFAQENTLLQDSTKQEYVKYNVIASIGFNSEKLQEFVYEEDKTLLSRLDYVTPFVPHTKLELEFYFFNAFFSGYFESVIPVKSGNMEDSDFAKNGSLSQYSKHDIFVDKDYSFNIKTGYKVNIKSFFIEPAVSFTYRNFKFTTQDGYKQVGFSSIESDTNKTLLHGSFVSYEQQQLLPAINLKLGVEFSKNLLVTLDSAFYPYLFITSVDNHHYRKIQFVDIMNGGNGFYISLSAEYKKFILQLGYFYLQVQKMGESKMYTIGEKVAAQKLSDFPGTTDFMFYMSVKYRIN